MGKIYRSITELVGKTPLLELANYEKKHDLSAKLDAGQSSDKYAPTLQYI